MIADGDRPVAFLTGAAGGIGRELAGKLAPRYRLVATGRAPRETVADLLPANAEYVEADLADPVAAVAEIRRHLAASGITAIRRAILNAGTGVYGEPADETPQQIAEILAVNLTSSILIARALAPLLEAGSGRLTLIGSVAHKGTPKTAAYAASKAGLHGFARALGEEWRGRIDVQIIHPGPVATDMHAKAGYEPGRLRRLFLTPEMAAAEIARLIETGRSPATLSPLLRLIPGRAAQ